VDAVIAAQARLPALSRLQLREREILRRQIRRVLRVDELFRGGRKRRQRTVLREEGNVQVFRHEGAARHRLRLRAGRRSSQWYLQADPGAKRIRGILVGLL